jgi:hypothetical protein
MERLKELKNKLFGKKPINDEEIQAVINKHRAIYQGIYDDSIAALNKSIKAVEKKFAA